MSDEQMKPIPIHVNRSVDTIIRYGLPMTIIDDIEREVAHRHLIGQFLAERVKLATENEQLKARVAELEADNQQLRILLERSLNIGDEQPQVTRGYGLLAIEVAELAGADKETVDAIREAVAARWGMGDTADQEPPQ